MEIIQRKPEQGKKAFISPEMDTWVNQRTGEVIEGMTVFKQVSRSGFMITYMQEIIGMIEALGSKRLKVVKYLLENMDMSNNYLLATVDEITKGAGVSKTVVVATLRMLDVNGIIQRRTGAVMINPRLIHRGREGKEKALITRFMSFGEGHVQNGER